MSQLEIDFCYRRERAGLSTSDRRIAWDLHLDSLNDFYGDIGAPATMIRSHATCLCCLKEVPSTGFALRPRAVRTMRKSFWTAGRVIAPTKLKLKPPEAGACTLSLDDGGVRGVVQLEMLREIELALGNHVPVHKFFDLIVGAGTGGLVGISLVAGGRSIEQCLDLFLATCDHAYATESGNKSLLEKMSRFTTDKRRTKTLGLHSALRDAFTSHRSFFGETDQFSPDIRIAMTCTNEADGKTLLLANYRRPASQEEPDAVNFKSVKVGDRRLAGNEEGDNAPFKVASEEVLRTWPVAHSSMVCLSLGTGQNWRRISTDLQTEAVRFGKGNFDYAPPRCRRGLDLVSSHDAGLSVETTSSPQSGRGRSSSSRLRKYNRMPKGRQNDRAWRLRETGDQDLLGSIAGEAFVHPMFFAPSTGHLAHGYPLGGLPRLLIDHRSSVTSRHSARRPTSLSSSVREAIGRTHPCASPPCLNTLSTVTLFGSRRPPSTK
ncbi:hypothetical protein E2P81_ATG10307 [Venturia nashicola]|nr:hypothetical protein E2P81_ATG10307 [Venturia nashicola]